MFPFEALRPEAVAFWMSELGTRCSNGNIDLAAAAAASSSSLNLLPGQFATRKLLTSWTARSLYLQIGLQEGAQPSLVGAHFGVWPPLRQTDTCTKACKSPHRSSIFQPGNRKWRFLLAVPVVAQYSRQESGREKQRKDDGDNNEIERPPFISFGTA